MSGGDRGSAGVLAGLGRNQDDRSNGIPWFSYYRAERRVTCYYAYIFDERMGPGFIKICAYAPYRVKVCRVAGPGQRRARRNGRSAATAARLRPRHHGSRRDETPTRSTGPGELTLGGRSPSLAPATAASSRSPPPLATGSRLCSRTTSSTRRWCPQSRSPRFPRWLGYIYPAVIGGMRAAARVTPALPVPFGAYLDIRRVCRDDPNAEYSYTDPLGQRSYPLLFIARPFGVDLSGMRDGSIGCPVTVIAAAAIRCFRSATPGRCSTESWRRTRTM